MKRKFSVIAVVFLMLIGALFAMTACSSSAGKEISVDKGNMPQVVFVQGNELDLSKGRLTVGNSTIPLDSKGVEVAGYDKDALGEQRLTISYKGQSTELTVTVVPRVQTAEKYTYFVGEPLDAVQVRLKITKDDGSDFTVKTGDDGLTVENFDSSVENETLTLTAIYNKDGLNYRGSFDVAVVTPQIVFKKPRKSAYGSHETALDWTGASLTLKSEDGRTSRNIAITDLTASGFSPEAATAETPSVNQTVTVSYLGREVGTLELTITYSDVSRIREIAGDLKQIDWTYDEGAAEASELLFYYPQGATEERGKAAMKALSLYCSLSSADAKYLAQDELDAIARMAVVFGYNELQAALERGYADVFRTEIVNGVLSLSYTCSTPEAAKSGYERLTAVQPDEDTKLIFDYCNLLNDSKWTGKCGNTEVYPGASLAVGDLLTLVYDSAALKKIFGALDGMVQVFTALSDVPADWRNADIASYKSAVEETCDLLIALSGNSVINDSAYTVLEKWRSDEFFEILYRYYYSVYKSADETASDSASDRMDALAELRLPARLEESGNLLFEAYYEQLLLRFTAEAIDEGSVDLSELELESSGFMSAYKKVMEDRERLLAENDAMYLELYKRTIEPDLKSVLQEGTYGYYALNGTSAFDGAYREIWEKYLWLLEKFGEDNAYAESAEFQTLTEEMFVAFVGLRPNQQYNFITSLNYLYFNGVPQVALYFDEDGALYSLFASFIYSHYLAVFGMDAENPDENNIGYDIFTDLLCALECYARLDVDVFCEFMSAASQKYESWNADEKNTFDTHLKFFYDKYMGYFGMYHKETDEEENETYVFTAVELGEYRETFEEMEKELNRVYLAQLFLDYGELIGQTVPLYSAFFASYEKISLLADRILACGNEEILKAYYYQPYGSDGSSLYVSVYDAKGHCERYLSMLGINADEYRKSTSLRAFFAQSADFLWTNAEKLYSQYYITDPGDKFEYNGENINSVMSAFRALSPDEQYLFISLDYMNLYYGGLETYFEEAFAGNDALCELSVAMLNLEIGYLTYRLFPDGVVQDSMTTREFVLSLWAEIAEGYNALSPDDRALFDGLLSEMYAYYESVCESLNAAD